MARLLTELEIARLYAIGSMQLGELLPPHTSLCGYDGTFAVPVEIDETMPPDTVELHGPHDIVTITNIEA